MQLNRFKVQGLKSLHSSQIARFDLKKERNLNKFPRPGLAFVKENGVKLKKKTKKEEKINLVRRPFSISATGCYRTGRIPRESRGLRDFYVWCFPGPLISLLQSSQSKQTRHAPDVEFLRFFKFFRNETEIWVISRDVSSLNAQQTCRGQLKR